jgi:cysteine synthase A
MGPGHTIVTVLCDQATRYAGKLYNPPFLEGKGLQSPPWLKTRPELQEVLDETLLKALPEE